MIAIHELKASMYSWIQHTTCVIYLIHSHATEKLENHSWYDGINFCPTPCDIIGNIIHTCRIFNIGTWWKFVSHYSSFSSIWRGFYVKKMIENGHSVSWSLSTGSFRTSYLSLVIFANICTVVFFSLFWFTEKKLENYINKRTNG